MTGHAIVQISDLNRLMQIYQFWTHRMSAVGGDYDWNLINLLFRHPQMVDEETAQLIATDIKVCLAIRIFIQYEIELELNPQLTAETSRE